MADSSTAGGCWNASAHARSLASAPGAPQDERVDVAASGTHSRWTSPRWHRSFEPIMVLLLCLLVLVFHDVGYLLRQPYWNDEAWVAVTTRFPVTQLPALTSSTPIGWSFLLRLVTFGHGESGRFLPLAFAACTVVPAYWLTRGLEWRDHGTAIAASALTAAAVLLAPAMLVRDDLKQYTADACMALLVLATTARLERQWSRRGLALLSAAVCGGMLLSVTAAFAGAAALGAICLVQLARRDWRRLAEAAAATAGSAVAGLAAYEIFYARAVVPGLVGYWQAYFLPVHDGLTESARFVVGHFELIRHYFGLGPASLAIPLVLAGLATIVRLGRPATAAAIAALWPEMLILSALQKYPFLDLRTSTFLLTITAVVAAIGVAGICGLLRAALGRGQLATTMAVAVAAFALTGFGLAAGPYLRSRLIPLEDIRQQTGYVAAHAAPHDPIVVNSNSNWGFAYYWHTGTPAIRPDPANLQGYQAVFPSQPRIVVARDRDVAAIKLAMGRAVNLAPRASCSRIWLIRTHVNATEHAAWLSVLAELRLTPRYALDGVAYVQEGPSSCA